MTGLMILGLIIAALLAAATFMCAHIGTFDRHPAGNFPDIGEGVRLLGLLVVYLTVWVVPSLLATIVWSIWLR